MAYEPGPALLLVEDEAAAAEVLRDYLVHNGFQVHHAPDGNAALRLLEAHGPTLDLAILDIMVPGPDGRALLQRIRDTPATATLPVLFLTAKDREQDEIQGLAAGADDYLAKPASLSRILAHVRSLLRRAARPSPLDGKTLRFGPLALDLDAACAFVAGQRVELTATEFHLLRTMLGQPRRVFRRVELLEQALEKPDEVLERTVDVHIKNLRLKLAARQPDAADAIRTFRGLGYGMNPDMG